MVSMVIILLRNRLIYQWFMISLLYDISYFKDMTSWADFMAPVRRAGSSWDATHWPPPPLSSLPTYWGRVVSWKVTVLIYSDLLQWLLRDWWEVPDCWAKSARRGRHCGPRLPSSRCRQSPKAQCSMPLERREKIGVQVWLDSGTGKKMEDEGKTGEGSACCQYLKALTLSPDFLTEYMHERDWMPAKPCMRFARRRPYSIWREMLYLRGLSNLKPTGNGKGCARSRFKLEKETADREKQSKRSDCLKTNQLK